jgi:hypothetical protein
VVVVVVELEVVAMPVVDELLAVVAGAAGWSAGAVAD